MESGIVKIGIVIADYECDPYAFSQKLSGVIKLSKDLEYDYGDEHGVKYWRAYSSIDIDDFDSMFEKTISIFEKKDIASIGKQIAEPSIRAELSVTGVLHNRIQVGINLSRVQIAKLSNLGISFDIDVYVTSGDFLESELLRDRLNNYLLDAGIFNSNNSEIARLIDLLRELENRSEELFGITIPEFDWEELTEEEIDLRIKELKSQILGLKEFAAKLPSLP